jgi:hypothetical protein
MSNNVKRPYYKKKSEIKNESDNDSESVNVDTNDIMLKKLDLILKQNEELKREIKILNEKIENNNVDLKLEHMFNKYSKTQYKEYPSTPKISSPRNIPKNEATEYMIKTLEEYIGEFDKYNDSVNNVMQNKNKKLMYFNKIISEIDKAVNSNYRLNFVNLSHIMDKPDFETKIPENVYKCIKFAKSFEDFIYVEKPGIFSKEYSIYVYY